MKQERLRIRRRAESSHAGIHTPRWNSSPGRYRRNNRRQLTARGANHRLVTIAGRLVSLGPVSREDYPAFYEWRIDLDSLPLWSLRSRRMVTFEEFVPELDRFLGDGGITMVVVENKTGLPIGFVRAYDLNWLDGWGWVGCYAAHHGRLRPLHFAEAVALFFGYLFSHFPLRKVYAEIAAYNSNSQGIAEKLGFTEEGRLRDYVWLGDRFWDARHYSLARENWHRTLERFRRLPGIAAALDQITLGDLGATQPEDRRTVPSS